jgi:hypothetical protein
MIIEGGLYQPGSPAQNIIQVQNGSNLLGNLTDKGQLGRPLL